MLTTALILFTVTTQAQALKPAGVLTVESGSVEISRTTSARPARKRDRVMEGDVLSVSSDGKALVTLQSGREVWGLSSGSKVKVELTRLVGLSGTKPALVARLNEVKRDPSKDKTIGLSGIVRGGGRGVEPIGAFRSGPITLVWNTEAWVVSTKVSVYSAEGPLVWSQDEVGPQMNSVTIPLDKVSPGQWYQVILVFNGAIGADGLGRRERRQTEVKLLSKEEVKELLQSESIIRTALKDDPVTLSDALGELYAAYSLTGEFISAIEKAYKDASKDPEALARLGDLFLLAGFKPEAMTSYTRAVDLGNRDPEVKEAMKILEGGGASR